MERKTTVEFKQEIEARTRQFAVSVFRFLNALERNVSNKVIAYQLGKAASSIGANYREANRAESRDDFAHKLQIALKEASEACYWFEILSELNPGMAKIEELSQECVTLRNLFQSIGSSVRSRAVAGKCASTH